MHIIRAASIKDLDKLEDSLVGNFTGMSVSHDREKLRKKIEQSEKSFSSEIIHPKSEEYFFVLEELPTSRIGGTCDIRAKISPLESCLFKVTSQHSSHPANYLPQSLPLLKPIRAPAMVSEICALYLHPDFRHSGLGKLLSLSRFLFMAAFPNRIHATLVAVMRAYIDEDGNFPFWNGIAGHFSTLSYPELMTYLSNHPEKIAFFLPKHPIYIGLLPKEVQSVIGKIHDQTAPALKILQQEGFQYNGLIDAFDGGPVLTAQTKSVRSIKNSCTIKIDVKKVIPDESILYLISNHRIDFRATYGHIHFIDNHHGIISAAVAEALEVNIGDTINYVKVK